MRLARYQKEGDTGFGAIDGKKIVDLTEHYKSFDILLEKITKGESITKSGPKISDFSFLPPTTSTNTTFAAALNYRSHIDEASESAPERPLIFLKLYRSLVGHENDIRLHSHLTNKLDYEAELAVIIGKQAWRVSTDEARDYVAGYTILNDTSARDLQRLQIGDDTRTDWFSAKTMQNTTPVGPSVVTTDSIKDPHDLRIQSHLNGELMQDESTKLMIQEIDDLISNISQRVVLEPGDIIATGTPEGVGLFQDIKLEDGDRVKIDIDDIGTLSNTVRRTE